MESEQHSEREAAAVELIDLVKVEKARKTPVNLDDLIELLDADDLRNVAVMLRPKGITV